MWRKWIPFLRKDEKQENPSNRLPDKENGGEGGTIPTSEGTGDYRPTRKRGQSISRQQLLQKTMPHSPPRSPFIKRHVSYLESGDSTTDSQDRLYASTSVANQSRPLLTTPLLPKIKRVMELNDSLQQGLGGRAPVSPSSSPMSRRVGRSLSLNYRPTHPTRSTPGRLPIVRLQRRPSLHLITGRSVQSPSTIKVAAPEPSRLTSFGYLFWRSPRHAALMGQQVHISPTQSSSPQRNVAVDTQTVLSALRERSNRKRNTMASVEDSFGEEEFTHMAKRRRQDSTISTTSSAASMPAMPEKLPDLSRQQHDPFSPITYLPPVTLKRPSAPQLDETNADVQPMAKSDKRHGNGRILSSLSSFRRVGPNQDSEEAPSPRVQATQTCQKRTRSDRSDSISETQKDLSPVAKKVTPDDLDNKCTPAPSVSVSSRGDSKTFGNETSAGAQSGRDEDHTPSTVKMPTGTSEEQESRGKTQAMTPLQRSAAKLRPVVIASPADVEKDRKAEEELRVHALLDFLNDDNDDDGFTCKPAASCVQTSSTLTTKTTTPAVPAVTFSTTSSSTTVTTTASSLSQLLASPLSTPSTTSTSSGLSLSHSSLTSISSSTSAAGGALSGLGQSTAQAGLGAPSGLLQSSAESSVVVSSQSVNKPLSSTGSLGFFSNAGSSLTPPSSKSSLAPASTSAGMSAASTLASLSGIASSVSSSSSSVPSSSVHVLPSSLTSPSSGVPSSTLPSTFSLAGYLSSPATTSVGQGQSREATVTTAGQSRYTFRPVFEAATSPQLPSYQDAAKPQASVGGGFSAANLQSTGSAPLAGQTTLAASGGFSFGSTVSGQSATPGSAGIAVTSVSGAEPFSFSAVSATSGSSGGSGFNFGQASSAGSSAVNPSAADSFNFAQSATVTATSSGSGAGAGAGFSLGASFSAGPTSTATSVSQPSQGFSFGASGFGAASQSAATVAPVQTLGLATTGVPATSAAAFSFGTSVSSATSAAPFSLGAGFSFGQSAQQTAVTGQGPQQTAASAFGQNTQLSTMFGDAGGKGFQPKNLFGTPKTESSGSLSSSTGFAGFGAAPTTSSSPAAMPLFGQQAATVSTATPSVAGGSGLSFGANPTSTTTVGFGQTSSTSSAPAFGAGAGAAFSFGSNAGSSSNGVSGGASALFGQAATTSTSSSFGPGQQSSKPSSAGGVFAFGQTAAPSPAAGAFSFGATTTTTTTTSTASSSAAPVFGFGSTGATTTAAASSGFGGAGATSVPGIASSFSFTAGSKATANPFGQTVAAQGSQPAPFSMTKGSTFTFGSNPSQSASAPAFGAPQAQSTTAFGTSAPAFGTPQTQSTTAFGISAPAFGTPQTQSTTAFGMAAPAFGTPQTHSTTAFGTAAPTFGTPQTQSSSAFGTAAPAFGTPQTSSGQAFGGFGKSLATSGFNFGGSSTPAASAAPAFGASTVPAPGFGTPTPAPTPAFGASHSNSNTPVFGATANQNSSATAGNAFVFGAGQSTTSGFAFGSTPNKSGGGGGNGGFDFSASLGGSSQFNFAAGGGGGQGNMFTPGASATAPRPRNTTIRARRRGNRK